MATNRFGLSSSNDIKHQPLLTQPLYKESFSFESTPVEDFLIDRNPNTLTSLVFKYFIPVAEIEANVTSDKKSLMKMMKDSYEDPSSDVRSTLTSIFGISSQIEDIGEYMIHSGSSREELFLPPYQVRTSDAAAFSEIDPYESADLDVMLLIRQPLMCEPVESIAYDDSASLSSKVQLVMDSHGCHVGFTKILIQGNAECLPEPIRKAAICCEDRNYLSSEVLLASIYDPASIQFNSKKELKGGQLTRQGPAINMKVLDDGDSVKSVTDLDLVPTFKCTFLPKELSSWQKRIQTRQWPPWDIRQQLLQKPCYVVGVGYHDSATKDMEWRLSTSAIESVLGSSLTLVQRKCYILFKILHKTALKEPKLLATYHLKNILFEALEETDGSACMWTEVNLMFCLCFLLDKLINHLEKGRLMSYFIDDYNLIDYYPAETIKAVLEKVKTVRKVPHKYLLNFDFKFAFDFCRNKIFQDDFELYFKLYDQNREDFQLVAHSIVLSLIRHAHSDISTNDIVLYNRAFALLDESWKILKVVNPEFNASQLSFMSDVTYSGLELDRSRKFQEYLRIKEPGPLEPNENVKAIASMIGFQLPSQGEANPIFKLLTYRMMTLESFCESKEFHASGKQIMNAEIFSGNEPQTIAISAAVQRAMLKIALWMSKIFTLPALESPQELQLRKAAVAMEMMQEVIKIQTESEKTSEGADSESFTAALTGMMNMFPRLKVDDSTFEHAKEMEALVEAAPRSKGKDTDTATMTAYDLLMQYLNGSLDVNFYFVSAYNALFLFLMFGMKKEACKMLIRLNPTSLWVFSFLNGPFLEIELKNLNRYVSSFIFPDHLLSYIDSVSSCKVKIEFFQHFLLIECSTANPGFFEASEVENALASANKFFQEMHARKSKQHCAFLLSVMNFKLSRFAEAQACLEAIAREVDKECRQVVEEAVELYQCLQMSLDM